jgi:FtsP/CotA-like multicopper oxidase with cupredoxin domain
MLRDVNAGWDLLEFRVGAGSGAGTIPSGTLSAIDTLAAPEVTRDFSFDGMTRINGLEWDPARIDFEVPFGQTERWRFTTGGNAPHPIHIHGASFQVQSRSGGRGIVFPWERGWSGYRAPVGWRDRRSAHPLRWLSGPLSHAPPQARARGSGNDDELRGRLSRPVAPPP